jgi:crotonobetainyl-CoA:carnitine CoA-transferase CaiB-like acyl-CoA transferase
MPGDLLAGVRVVELAQFVFVPMAATLLADWGADVVKVEHPVTGDGYRGLTTQGIGAGSGAVNPSWELANRGKRSIGIDVKTEAGRDLLLELLGTADVFCTNLLPAALDRLGLGADALCARFPRLVYARGDGYGPRGPDADKPAYDATAYWARGGLGDTLTPVGLDEPIGQRAALGDRTGAVHLAFGITAALLRRAHTGQGAVVDVSLLATAMWTLASDVVAAQQGTFRRARLHDPASLYPAPNPLVGAYRCADGRFLALCFLQPDRYWPDLCRALARPDLTADPRFADIGTRAAHTAECRAVLGEVFATRTLAEWCAAFADEHFPWEPYRSVTELAEDPQVVANGFLGTLATPGGDLTLPTGAVQVDGRPPVLRRAPEHGAHTDEILAELGHDWDRIVGWKTAGIVT